MRLAHLHIPHRIPYSHSLKLQTALLERHFSYKDQLHSGEQARRKRGNENANSYLENTSSQRRIDKHGYKDDAAGLTLSTPSRVTESSDAQIKTLTTSTFSSLSLSPPDPVVLTFATHPTYTVGRRHLLSNPISESQQNFLTASGRATFHASPRGGLLTYHGPGQVTGYVIADLRRHGITARCWVKMLEKSVMRTCAHWGVGTMRTRDPGVWVKNNDAPTEQREVDDSDETSSTDRKICAIGVQVSRGITSHGIGLNVYDAPLPSSAAGPVYEFTAAQTRSPSYDPLTRGYLSWGFSRVVACGLEGKSVTWLMRERRQGPEPGAEDHSVICLESVADVFAQQVMHGLNAMKASGKESVHEVYRIHESQCTGPGGDEGNLSEAEIG
ncbi:uncharacterized protein Z518_05803 [Rhinocladiella mackenziei CBS 650.93]|uniref:BPL/LPL catalytic domain-containing protein n=1 Tax=Rhinocladiella mackenziei CBS 650.93 TaxID=1442369 RepID=A0A0D2FS06_9EURO|nr:uncharacterized protein Z518_05803 [Rhinocladiella mackenziei CBS 650.93]KIX04932.1 hypothetical protein Z518_05803 [Rhinocladiella mackenziei CBS 650.93]